MKHIKGERHDAVGIITIDRTERFNSLDVATAQDLRKAGLQLARDDGVRALVIGGAGGIFCSGADLKYIRAGGDPADLSYLAVDGAVRTRYGGEWEAIYRASFLNKPLRLDPISTSMD